MSGSYQITGRCGHVVFVNLAQAGETVRCAQCGESIEVPTYRELKMLAPEPVPTRKQSAWSPAQGFQFVVGVCLIVAALMAASQIVKRLDLLQTEPPELRQVVPDVSQTRLGAPDLWAAWVSLRDDPVAERDTPFFLEQRKLAAEYRTWLGMLGVLAAAGIVLIGLSIFRRRPAAT